MMKRLIASTMTQRVFKLEQAVDNLLDIGFDTIELCSVDEWVPHFDLKNSTDKKIINKNIPKDDYGLEYYPQGLFDTLAYLSDNYPGKNIIITENGIGVKKWGNYE